jgi:hypothetical protein
MLQHIVERDAVKELPGQLLCRSLGTTVHHLIQFGPRCQSRLMVRLDSGHMHRHPGFEHCAKGTGCTAHIQQAEDACRNKGQHLFTTPAEIAAVLFKIGFGVHRGILVTVADTDPMGTASGRRAAASQMRP